jgi:hypothetical protein
VSGADPTRKTSQNCLLWAYNRTCRVQIYELCMWLSPVPRLGFLALIALGIHTVPVVFLWLRKDVFFVLRFWPFSRNWRFFVVLICYCEFATAKSGKISEKICLQIKLYSYKKLKVRRWFPFVKSVAKKFQVKKFSHKSSVVDLDSVESVPFGAGIIFLNRIRHFWRTNLYNNFTNLYFVFNLKDSKKSPESFAVVQLCTLKICQLLINKFLAE